MLNQAEKTPLNIAQKLLTTNSTHIGLPWLTDSRRTQLDVSIALALSLPAGILVALAISSAYLHDGHHPIYKAKRHHPSFPDLEVVKVRTMQPGADKVEDQFLGLNGFGINKITGTDTRITPVGKLWRRTSVDELPQLLVNVMLRHDMAIVGPRPLVKSEYDLIPCDQEPARDEFLGNLSAGMKFGLCGLSQLFVRTSPDISLKLDLDNLFASKASWVSDLRIIAATFATGTILKGK